MTPKTVEKIKTKNTGFLRNDRTNNINRMKKKSCKKKIKQILCVKKTVFSEGLLFDDILCCFSSGVVSLMIIWQAAQRKREETG